MLIRAHFQLLPFIIIIIIITIIIFRYISGLVGCAIAVAALALGSALWLLAFAVRETRDL